MVLNNVSQTHTNSHDHDFHLLLLLNSTRPNSVLRYRVFLKSSLRKHLHAHTGERPYSCRVCGAGFSRKDVLENHVLSVHCLKRAGDSWQPQAERSKSHGCDECGASFYDRLVELLNMDGS